MNRNLVLNERPSGNLGASRKIKVIISGQYGNMEKMELQSIWWAAEMLRIRNDSEWEGSNRGEDSTLDAGSKPMEIRSFSRALNHEQDRKGILRKLLKDGEEILNRHRYIVKIQDFESRAVPDYNEISRLPVQSEVIFQTMFPVFSQRSLHMDGKIPYPVRS